MDFWSGNVYESHVFGLCFTNEDQVEGMRAFVEKDKAVFSGKALPRAGLNRREETRNEHACVRQAGAGHDGN